MGHSAHSERRNGAQHHAIGRRRSKQVGGATTRFLYDGFNFVQELTDGSPLLVCEPVLAEVMYLLARYSMAQDALFELLQNGALSVAFRIEEHVGALRKLLQKHRDHIKLVSDCSAPSVTCAISSPYAR